MKKILLITCVAVVAAVAPITASATPPNAIGGNTDARVPDTAPTLALLGLGIGALFTIHRRLRPAN